MTTTDQFEIKRFSFDNTATESLKELIYSKEQWPVVYLLSDDSIKEAYIGETTDIVTRISTHLKGPKQKLSVFHLVGSNLFNKSATLDIESNLIKYISGDGKFKLMNGNLGLANHTYYQKQKVYWNIFCSIWNKLRSDGVVRHSIETISNSNLFKYSPYKSLTAEQSKAC
jgi:uncharacterized protein